MDAMAADTPTLRFPPGTTQNGGTSGGGSNQRLRTSTRITSDLAPAALVAYLGEQMSEQGWTIDSSWAGQRGAGGSWVRESESGARVVNSLAIIERGNDSFEVQLTTLTL
jgi:hypothetical protein